MGKGYFTPRPLYPARERAEQSPALVAKVETLIKVQKFATDFRFNNQSGQIRFPLFALVGSPRQQ